MSETDNKNERDLLLFQLGPVQEFIAQAAEVSDLWAGSYLLSSLVWAGIKSLQEKGIGREDFVFPSLVDDTVRRALEDRRIPTIPNRFLCWVPSGKGSEIAEGAKDAIRHALMDYIAEFAAFEGAELQAEQFLQMTWATLEDPARDMGQDYRAVGRRLALRRNLREFDPWRETEGLRNAPKDYLSGKEAALADRRGAVNLIKKGLAAKAPGGFAAGKSGYIAVVAMDGDRMGATLSGLKTADEHRAFSGALAQFACSVEGLLPEGGQLMYAGGDDVLAVVPATSALATAQRISTAFSDKMQAAGLGTVSASAGVAVGSVTMPLQDLVSEAHAAEHRAKTAYGRSAFAVSVFKRSGEILQWGGRWDSCGLKLYESLSSGVSAASGDVTHGFPHKLASFLSLYDLERGLSIPVEDMRKIVQEEVLHVWGRSNVGLEIADAAAKYATEVFADRHAKLADFLAAFLCEDFINRPREERE